MRVQRFKNEFATQLCVLLPILVNQEVTVSAAHASCQSRIWLNISSTYMSETPPVGGDCDFFTLHQQMWLVDIVGLEEPDETLVTSWLSSITWHDERLTWDPVLFDNCTYTNVPGNLIYLPDIDILNTHDVLSNTKMFNRKNRINIYHNGTVEWFSFGVFSTSCSLDLTYFPFDYQTCYIDVTSLSLLTHNMHMRASHENSFSMEEYRQNDLWDIIQYKVMNYSAQGNEFLRYYLLLRRRPFYSLINIATPSIILSLLELSVFWLPVKADEKISHSVTIFLSSMILSGVIVTNLPASSNTYPLLGIFSMLSSMYAAGTVIATVVVLDLHHRASQRGSQPPPQRLVKCLRALNSLFCQCQTCPCCHYKPRFILTSSTVTSSTAAISTIRSAKDSFFVGNDDVIEGATSELATNEDVAGTSRAFRNGHNGARCVTQSQAIDGSSQSSWTPAGSWSTTTSQAVSNIRSRNRLDNRRLAVVMVPADADFYKKWHNVAVMLDSIFFWLFFIIISTTIIACFVIVPAFNVTPQLSLENSTYTTID